MKQFAILLAIFLTSQMTFAQSKIDRGFFDKTQALLQENVRGNGVDYGNLRNNSQLQDLIKTIGQANLDGLDAKTIQAFYINAYNLLVIDGVVEAYPIKSVLDVPGFFERKKKLVAGEKTTLNDLERKNLLDTYGDARYHFVLVCGAKGCPPITNFAYRPEKLEEQLEQQTRLALNDANFVQVDASSKKVGLSQIFKWYVKDFGKNTRTSLAYVNSYREQTIPDAYKIGFYDYDWSLNNSSGDSSSSTSPQGASNAGGNNASRYVTSSTIAKGTTETRIFNNLYTQKTGAEKGVLTDRATFFSTNLSFLYGFSNRFNAGLDIRYRRVRNDNLPSSPFSVLGGASDAVSTRSGITAFGPRIRWAPFVSLPNFSLQSTFSFGLGNDLEGNDELPFIDWNGATWITQFFNDFSIGNNFSFFTELDFILEDLGGQADNLNRFSTPVTLILSYFPNPKTTIYLLSGFSPFWQSEFDYFAQAGIGTKYQFNKNVEIEFIYTGFTNKFLQSIDGSANTFNIGLRFSR